MKRNLCIFLVLACTCVQAVPSVQVVGFRQRWPWNGLVDVDYIVSGVERPGDFELSLTVSATVGSQSTNITARSFVNALAFDLPTHDGTHRVTWDAVKDGAKFLAGDAKARIELRYNPYSGDDADYMIVDLSPGAEASSYPVRWVKKGTAGSAAFNLDCYKTTKLVLKRVPKGVFLVGVDGISSLTTEMALPARWVELTSDFFAGLFEVTQRQYELVCGVNPSKFSSGADSPMRPVENVSWNALCAADGFISRIKTRAQYAGAAMSGFNLPTEAQWERAAHGVAGARSHLDGNKGAAASLGEYAWIGANSGGETHVVGTTTKNQGYGWYDIQGNVGELCLDDKDAAGFVVTPKESPDVNPCKGFKSGYMVYKGGGYSATNLPEIRMDRRLFVHHNTGFGSVGFRLFYTCPETKEEE
jgi:formylglycine-generating enzyme required for sulfatase activity